MEGPSTTPKAAPVVRVGGMVRNKLSGMDFQITGMQRTKKGRVWTLVRNGFQFTCHVDQLAARYEVIE